MAHRLFPVIEGTYLEPLEIVRRLKAEFDLIEADASAGTEVVADMIKQFQRMNAPPEIIDAHQAMLGTAIRILVSDREDFDNDYLVLIAMPNSPPFISYSSKQHEESANQLLERTCQILRYRAVLV